MAPRFVLPYQTVIDPTGVPIPGARLNFYTSGTDDRQDTFSDNGLTIPNTNPVEANGAGMFPNIFLASAAYKVVLTDALGDEIWTADPVQGGAGGSPGAVDSLRLVTADTTVTTADQFIEVDASLGPVKITYPLALGDLTVVQPVTILKIDNTMNQVTVVDDGAPGTIRGALIQPANGRNMDSFEVYSNGAALRII